MTRRGAVYSVILLLNSLAPPRSGCRVAWLSLALPSRLRLPLGSRRSARAAPRAAPRHAMGLGVMADLKPARGDPMAMGCARCDAAEARARPRQ